MLAFWAVVVVLIVWGVRSSTDASRPREANTALRILDERLARGEIDGEKYVDCREVLTGHR